MEQYILAHDLGTSGNKATLYSLSGSLGGSITYPYGTLTPKDGFVEQDANIWWEAVCRSTSKLLAENNISPAQIAAVSFSGQMMGCLIVDKDGNALRPAIIWADTRYSGMDSVFQSISPEHGYRLTGHRLGASYSAAKLRWLTENEPETVKKAYKMLNAKDYIVHRLTGVFATDYSDASGTNLMDLQKKCWSETLINAFGIDKSLLPEIVPSTSVVGSVTLSASREMGLLEGTPVVMGGGDGCCASVGAGVVEKGKLYNVLGSSSWISNVQPEPLFDNDMRTFNWVSLDENLYAPCGTMQAAGLSLSWMADTFFSEEKQTARELNRHPMDYLHSLADKISPGSENLLFLPYLLGERSPRWNLDARGTFIGLGVQHGKAHMMRAAMEGVAFNLKVILDILESNLSAPEIILIGGGAKSRVFVQMLADVWQKPAVLPRHLEEATSIGAAVCAGVGIGAFKDFSVVNLFNPLEKRVLPNPENAETYGKLYPLFNEAYDSLKSFYPSLRNT